MQPVKEERRRRTSLNTSWKMFCRSEGWRCSPFSRPSTVAWMTSSEIWRSGGSRPATPPPPPAAESMRRGLGSPRAPAAVEDESTLLARPASSSASLTTLGCCDEGAGGAQLGGGGRAVGPAMRKRVAARGRAPAAAPTAGRRLRLS